MPSAAERMGLLSGGKASGSSAGGFTGFPTKHPYVENKDGSKSNVLLSGFNIGGREYVLPTMVDGKKLSGAEAVAVAKKYGLDKYPSFSTQEEASKFAERYHSKIGPDGKVMKKSLGESIKSLIGM